MLQTWLRKPFTLKSLSNSISHTTSTNKDKAWFAILLSSFGYAKLSLTISILTSSQSIQNWMIYLISKGLYL